MLGVFEEQDARFGNRWTVPAWTWWLSRRHVALGRWLPSGGTPSSADTHGLGISYGYALRRLPWIQLWCPAEEAAQLAPWPAISICAVQGSPCCPAPLHTWLVEHRHIVRVLLYSDLKGLSPVCGFSPKLHKYSRVVKTLALTFCFKEDYFASQWKRTISTTMGLVHYFLPNPAEGRGEGILAGSDPHPMWSIWDFLEIQILFFGKLKGPKEHGRWTEEFNGL